MAGSLPGKTGFSMIMDLARRRFSSPERLTRINRIAGGLQILVAVVIAVTTP